MDILIINGSPKGAKSTTLQSCLYIERHNGKHSFTVLNAAAKIGLLRKDFSSAKTLLEKADLIIFAYPVYTFFTPSQLQEFIFLLKQSDTNIRGKFATQISSSKHFYDITASEYIKENCIDLGLNYIDGLCTDMDDLLKAEGKRQILNFFKRVIWETEGCPVPVKTAEKDIVIVTDSSTATPALEEKIKVFRSSLAYSSRIADIGTYPIKGGCLGCLKCAGDGKCIYRDGFDSFLRENIQNADAIVCAFTVTDHSMGYRYKMYDDRQFCNGHRTVTMGTPFAYLVDGDLENEKNLLTVLKARAQVGGNYLAAIAADGMQSPEETASRLAFALENSYTEPKNFYGVGGMRIFRDLIYLMQGIMKADHRFFKEHGQYDFPQKQRGTILKMKLAGMLMNPKVKKKLGENKINAKIEEGMLAPYKKALDED